MVPIWLQFSYGLKLSLVKLALGVLDCLRTMEISALNSSASVGLGLWQVMSIAAIYSLYGGLWSYIEVWPMCQSVSCVSDWGCWIDFTTHCLFGTDDLWTWFEWPFLSQFCCYTCYAAFYAIAFQILIFALP